MTKKDFVAIADALKRSNPRVNPVKLGDVEAKAAWNQWRQDVLHVQSALAALSPTFDRGRFLAACGSPD